MLISESLKLAKELGIDLTSDPRRDSIRYSANDSVFDVMIHMLYALDGFDEHYPLTIDEVKELTSIGNVEDILSLMVEDKLLKADTYEFTDEARFLIQLHSKNA